MGHGSGVFETCWESELDKKKQNNLIESEKKNLSGIGGTSENRTIASSEMKCVLQSG